MTVTTKTPHRFLVLAYRMPAEPTAGRVAVWRNLKKVGAVYLQDSVCVVPDTAALRRELALSALDDVFAYPPLLAKTTAPPMIDVRCSS